MFESDRQIGILRPISEALGFDPVLMPGKAAIDIWRSDSRGILDTVNVPISRKLVAEVMILRFFAQLPAPRALKFSYRCRTLGRAHRR